MLDLRLSTQEFLPKEKISPGDSCLFSAGGFPTEADGVKLDSNRLLVLYKPESAELPHKSKGVAEGMKCMLPERRRIGSAVDVGQIAHDLFKSFEDLRS